MGRSELEQGIQVQEAAISEAKAMANTPWADGYWSHAEAVTEQTAKASESCRSTLTPDGQYAYDQGVVRAALGRWSRGEF